MICSITFRKCNQIVCIADKCSLGGRLTSDADYAQSAFDISLGDYKMPFYNDKKYDRDKPSTIDAGELLRELVACPGVLQTFFIAGAALIEAGYKMSIGVTKNGSSLFFGFGKGDKFVCAFGSDIESLAADLGALLGDLDNVEKGLQARAKASTSLYNEAYGAYWKKAIDS